MPIDIDLAGKPRSESLNISPNHTEVSSEPLVRRRCSFQKTLGIPICHIRRRILLGSMVDTVHWQDCTRMCTSLEGHLDTHTIASLSNDPVYVFYLSRTLQSCAYSGDILHLLDCNRERPSGNSREPIPCHETIHEALTSIPTPPDTRCSSKLWDVLVPFPSWLLHGALQSNLTPSYTV